MVKDAVPPPDPPARSSEPDPYRFSFRLGWMGRLVLIVLLVLLWAGSQGGSRIVVSAHLKRTRVMARTIAHAVEDCARHHPVSFQFPRIRAEEGDNLTNTGGRTLLVDTLAGQWPQPGIDFLHGFREATFGPASAGAPAGWRDGIVREPRRCAIYDRYGGVFHVLIDEDGDGFVWNPNPDERAEGRTRLPLRAAVWTDGKDRKEETWEDNAMSWRGGWTDRFYW